MSSALFSIVARTASARSSLLANTISPRASESIAAPEPDGDQKNDAAISLVDVCRFESGPWLIHSGNAVPRRFTDEKRCPPPKYACPLGLCHAVDTAVTPAAAGA